MNAFVNTSLPLNSVRPDNSNGYPKVSCLTNFTQLLRRVFKRKQNQSQHKVHAVDSVRLIYLQRILSDTLLQSNQRNTINKLPKENLSTISMSPEVACPILRRRRATHSNVESLEAALRNYEQKHKKIIEHTAIPNEKFINPENPRKFRQILRLQLNSLAAMNSDEGGICKIDTSYEKDMIGRNLLDTQPEIERSTEDDEKEKNVCFDVRVKIKEQDSESTTVSEAMDDTIPNKRKYSININDLV